MNTEDMTPDAKADLLRPAITHMYEKEGRSLSYIGKLLSINRTTISRKVKEWDLKEAEPRRHMTPSNKKWLNANRNLIKARLDADVPLGRIATEVRKSKKSLYATFIPADDVLKKAYEDHVNRYHEKAKQRVETHKDKSALNYRYNEIPGEQWKDIPGYSGYQVSDHGRFRHYVKRYRCYILLQTVPNKNTQRPYIALMKDPDGTEPDGTPKKRKRKNLMAARIVAHAFVKGWSPEKNTVNHKDGDVNNSEAGNLEWSTQAENNLHAYRKLNRSVVDHKRYHFRVIRYKNTYEFKTVAAFARFLGKSETQVRRYLDEPHKHQIELINDCND